MIRLGDKRMSQTQVEEKEELKSALIELDQIERVQKKRKKESGIDYYIPNAAQLRCHRSLAKIVLFCGGNRCLGRETLVYDPVIGKEREVGSIDSDFYVLAWDGTGFRITKALKPFRKTIDNLYEIKLYNGGKFTASMSHVVLTPDGFRTISDVHVGDELYLSQTILEPFLSTHDEDDPSSYRKAEGSQSDYRSLLRLCDGLLRPEADSGQGVSPLPIGAPAPSFSWNSSYTDATDNTLTCSHFYQSQLNLSSLGDKTLTSIQSGDILPDASCTTLTLSDWRTSTDPRSTYESYPQESKSLTVQHPKSYDSIHPSNTPSVVVTSIVYIRNDYKWDFTVPVYHNYFASGAIHHNSGKSTVGAAEIG